MALGEAERILDLAVNQPISNGWRTRIFQLAEALFQSIHMQLNVRLYRGQQFPLCSCLPNPELL